MSWVDDQFVNCKRCGKNTGYSSFNCRSSEEYFFCTACGTVHNYTLKKDSEGNPILKRDDYSIDGRISFIKIDANKQLVESIQIDKNVTTETIQEWGRKDLKASMSRISNRGEIVDQHCYIVGIVNEDKTYTQIYGRIQAEVKDQNKIVFSEYYEFEEKYEEGYGVAEILSETGAGALYGISKDSTPEYIEELRQKAKETGGYLTLWDKEKNEVIVEFGQLNEYNPDEDCNCGECCCEGGCNCESDNNEIENELMVTLVEPEEKHECSGNCGGNCGDKCSHEGGCNCHEKESEKHEFEPVDSQGYAMECIYCGKYISIYEAEEWNKALEEKCPERIKKEE